MGANRQLAQPEAYPVAFLRAIEAGSGVMYAGDLPWAPISAAKRFRLCLALIRKTPGHRLYQQAKSRWAVRPSPRGLIVNQTDAGKEVPRLHGPLIADALNRAGQ